MKRVLEVAYPALNNSGVPAVIMGIVRELRNEYIFDALVFRSDAGFFKEEFQSYGGKIYTINCDKSKNSIKNIMEKIARPFRLYFGTKKILSVNHYDVIHCHNGWDAGWCLMAAKKKGVKVRVIHSHNAGNTFDKDSVIVRFYHFLMKRIILYSKCIKVGCAHKSLELLYGQNNDGIVILNGVDENNFSKNKILDKKIYKDEPRFIFIGRYCYQKNPIFAIEVFNEILKYKPNAKLKMIGFGEMESAVKLKIEDYQIEERVKILPHNVNIPNALRDSDFLILPSLFEGLPIVLIESQFMGVHCFVSNTVTKESDLGLCRYYSLEDSSKIWAKNILDYINRVKEEKVFPEKKYMDKYSFKNIAQQYRIIYESGEKTECK